MIIIWHCPAGDTLAFSTSEYQSDAGFQSLSLNPIYTNCLNLNHPSYTSLVFVEIIRQIQLY